MSAVAKALARRLDRRSGTRRIDAGARRTGVIVGRRPPRCTDDPCPGAVDGAPSRPLSIRARNIEGLDSIEAREIGYDFARRGLDLPEEFSDVTGRRDELRAPRMLRQTIGIQ